MHHKLIKQHYAEIGNNGLGCILPTFNAIVSDERVPYELREQAALLR